MKYKEKYTTSVHSETLFHAFDNIRILEGILSEKSFIPSYSKEHIKIEGNSTPCFFVPMVAFCDFKLAELGFHFRKYGSYAMGMSKEWAIKNGLNPVFYVNETCKLFYDVRSCLKEIEDANKDGANNSVISESVQKIMKLYCYLKNYQGSLTRKGETIEDFRFADDKEWRYVPNLSTHDLIILERYANQSLGGKDNINNGLRSNKGNHLRFDYDDIKFIIVPTEAEKENLIHKIYRIFNSDAHPNMNSIKMRKLINRFGCCVGLEEYHNNKDILARESRKIIDSLVSKIVVAEHLDF